MPMAEHSGPARLGRRTKELVRRLRPGDVAIVDHADLDRVSAEELLESGVRVVVNVAPSVTGRFPNPGPLQLVRGGVTLIDVAENGLFGDVREGESLVVRGSSLYRNGTRLAAGRALTTEELERAPGGAGGFRGKHDALPKAGGDARRGGPPPAAASHALS